MGISDDIHRKRPKKVQPDEVVPVVETQIKSEDVTDIIEPLPDTYEDHVDLSDTKSSFFEPLPRKTIKPKKLSKSFWLIGLLILLVLLLIAVAVYQNMDVIKRKIDNTSETSSTSTQTKQIDTTSSTAPDTTGATQGQDSAQAPTTTATTPEATPKTVDSAVINKSSFTIRVSNGNGLKGSADKVGDALKAAGFKVVSVGNATSYNYKTTIVYYKTGKEAEANLVKAALSSRSVSTQLSASLTAYDILVIVGSK